MKHFRPEEFACECGRDECDARPMDEHTLAMADMLREKLGAAVIINSGARCRFQNLHDGGAEDSQHLVGKAFDVRRRNPLYAAKLVKAALDLGFNGIGIGLTFVHLDTRPGPPMLWGYGK